MNRILIIGATSAIAEAVARRFAAQGKALYLAARNAERLESLCQDLRIRGAGPVEAGPFEAGDFSGHAELVARAAGALGGIDAALIAHGTLSDQAACAGSFDETLRELETNAISVVSLLIALAKYFEDRRAGTIAVIGSVAGDRGRPSNYTYGAAKGMVALYAQGLRARLHRSGVRVVTLKPGFVDTPMTAAFDKGSLWVQPERIARGICAAMASGRDVVYLPGFWRYIMLAVRGIPERWFKRLRW